MRASAWVTNFGDSVCMLSITPLINSAVHLYAVHFDHAVAEFFHLSGLSVAVVPTCWLVCPAFAVKPGAGVFDVAQLGALDFCRVPLDCRHDSVDNFGAWVQIEPCL